MVKALHVRFVVSASNLEGGGEWWTSGGSGGPVGGAHFLSNHGGFYTVLHTKMPPKAESAPEHGPRQPARLLAAKT